MADHMIFLIINIGPSWTQTMLVLLCFMTMVGNVCASPRPVESQDTVSRVNYGVVFQKQRELYLAQEYWLHTFQVNLPDLTFDIPIPNCFHSHLATLPLN